ncbi:hypothetical protein [Bacillus toyonensis]|uniref:hypothetical protein n=1 Tax=Bacillus toyonensis TaxID=155322 RepID=UPI000BF61AF6|nr:hypothetical protein [Bacillus toyonensis]PGF05148.1 hypothetical protein COM61_01620 [Bacillus toyonensis]
MSFKQIVYDELKGEVSPKRRAVVADRDSYLLGIASTKEELKTLLSKKTVSSVVCDQSIIGTVGFNVETEEVVVSKNISKIDPLSSPVVMEITGSRYNQDTKLSKEELKHLIERNNKYVNKVFKSLSGYQTVTKILDEKELFHDIPKVVYLKVGKDGVWFYLSELQLSIETYCGTFMVHGKGKDLYAHEIAELVSPVWGITEKEVEDILLSGF